MLILLDINQYLQFSAKEFVLRTRSTHTYQCLVPDAMHDVLEGSLPFEIKELLKHLISDRVISISSLNETIKLFPCRLRRSQ